MAEKLPKRLKESVKPKKASTTVLVQVCPELWDDANLCKKYNLTREEIAFIESMIRPME